MMKIMTLILQMLFANTGLFSMFKLSAYLIKKSLSKKLFFRNVIRALNSFDPDQVPYFVGPDLGQKCLKSSRYHEEN